MTESRLLADRLCKSAPIAVRATKEVAVRTRNMSWIEAVRFGETMRIVASRSAGAARSRSTARENRSLKR